MKRTLILLLFASALFIFLGPTKTYTSSSSPPIQKTGAPGENTCAECHTGGGGTGNVSIVFNNGLNLFVNESTYPVKVTVTDASQIRFGFSSTVIDQNDTMSGVLTPINFGNTSLTPNSAFTKFYIGHANATTTNTWTFNWTAPPASFGSTQVTFYVAGNAANGNFDKTGDHIYTSSVTVIRSAVGLDELSRGYVRLMQDMGVIVIDFALETPANANFTLIDISGRVLRSQFESLNQGLSSVRIPIVDLPKGLFFLTIDKGGSRNTYKFFNR